MKKKLCIYILTILCFSCINFDSLKAQEVHFFAQYGNCQSIDDDKVFEHFDNNDHSEICEDEDFDGWIIYVTSMNGDGYYCEYDEQRHQECQNLMFKYFSNGFSFSELGIGVDGLATSSADTVNLIAQHKPKEQDERRMNYYETKCSKLNKDNCIAKNCSYNKEHEFCSVNGLVYLSCGEADDIPEMVPVLVSLGVTGLKTVAPIVLIIMSIIQLVRSITSGKEDDIKKAQTGLIKRVIAAIVVFFVIAIVQFIMLRVADNTEKDSLRKCLSCFLNGTDSCGSLYYKDESGNHINIK